MVENWHGASSLFPNGGYHEQSESEERTAEERRARRVRRSEGGRSEHPVLGEGDLRGPRRRHHHGPRGRDGGERVAEQRELPLPGAGRRRRPLRRDLPLASASSMFS
jgi:hypothetical protein